MRKYGGVIMTFVIVIILALGMFFGGAASVLCSECFYDAENNQFCIVWADNVWAWDMEEK